MIRRFVTLVLPLAFAPALACAQDDGWRTERFNMVVRDQGVREVLTQFGTLAGIPVVVSDSIDERISARFEDATGKEIIDAIAREYALDWRFDGRRIEISANSEQVSRILAMGGVASDDLVEALKTLGAYESRFPITAIDGELGMLVGPPRYVAIVEIVLAELAEKQLAEQIALEERRKEEALQRAADAEARRRAEEIEAERLAELRRLLALRISSPRVQPVPVNDAPVVIRGGRWGG